MTRKNTFFRRILSLVLTFVTLVTAIPAINVFAAEDESTFDGCLGLIEGAIPVYSDQYGNTRSGSLFKYEGFTILKFTPYGAYIDYSTASGTKTGYVMNGDFGYDERYSSVGKITTTANVYYGPDTSTYTQAGAVYAGEYVAILAKNSYWAYIEYNTTAGRKRGYIFANCVQSFNTPLSGSWGDMYTVRTPQNWYMEGNFDVYSGPGPNYAKVGSVSNEYVIRRGSGIYLSEDDRAYYIEYTVNSTGKTKSGYILYLS